MILVYFIGVVFLSFANPLNAVNLNEKNYKVEVSDQYQPAFDNNLELAEEDPLCFNFDASIPKVYISKHIAPALKICTSEPFIKHITILNPLTLDLPPLLFPFIFNSSLS